MGQPIQWKEVWIIQTSSGMMMGEHGAVMSLHGAMKFDSKDQAEAWMVSTPINLKSAVAQKISVRQ
ncbi:MAG: hypothetical protein ACFE0I_20095 [Elainellaceae cyanobacterium]